MTDDDAARIEELEATVEGLTQELMDLQERVRDLEPEEADDSEAADRSVEELFEENGDGQEEATEDVETLGDDIIVG
jgi:predicted  nucleic acid-binding Zn-ribbon protein